MALTKYNYNSFDLTTAASKGLAFNSDADGFETSSAGAMTLIKTLTASSSGNLTFVHGTSDVVLDSTYPVYKFVCTSIHAATDNTNFMVAFRDGGSSYDATVHTTMFSSRHNEADSDANTGYEASQDETNSGGTIKLSVGLGTANDESSSGELYLFNPSSTTFVKHFICTTQMVYNSSYSANNFVAGYFNTTSTITNLKFQFNSGNIDDGIIKMYGVA